MTNIQPIVDAINNFQTIRFLKKEWMVDFITLKSETMSEAEVTHLAEDLFGLKAYFDRMMEKYTLEIVPYWEFSNCLWYLDNHFVYSGYVLNLTNATRILGNIRDFCIFLLIKGMVSHTDQIDRAIKVILQNNTVCIITDIPYTGNECYRRISKKGRRVSFYIYDKWILILLKDIGWNWKSLLEKASAVSSEKHRLCTILQQKLEIMGDTQIWDILRDEIFATDVVRATRWFYDLPSEA